jgi:hypothetical protein
MGIDGICSDFCGNLGIVNPTRNFRYCISVWAVVLVEGFACPAQIVAPALEKQADVIRDIDAVERNREANLAGYSVTEHYTIQNSHFQMAAEVVVQAAYRRAAGKTYQIQSRSGPSMLKDRLMDRILQEEANMSRGSAREQSLITSANYDMHLIGEEKIGDTRCLELDLMPRVKSPHLLRGKVWVDSGNKVVVRIEGQPPVGQSFFAGRPQVVRDYAVVDGIAFAQRSHAISSGLIQGKTEVTIIYDNYVVDRDTVR